MPETPTGVTELKRDFWYTENHASTGDVHYRFHAFPRGEMQGNKKSKHFLDGKLKNFLFLLLLLLFLLMYENVKM